MINPNDTGIVAPEMVRVGVRAIEKEISDQWKQAAEGGLPGVSAPLTRVILYNVIVYALSHKEAGEAAEIIAGLIAEHPARAIIADAQADEERRDADVSVLCSITERGRRLCGEEIRLHSQSLDEAALGTITPAMVPDLPVYLWTPGDLIWDIQTLRQLVSISDHWIVDSRTFTNLSSRFESIRSFGLGHKPSVTVHDLTWVGLSQWRETLAEHFDAFPARGYLSGIATVEITYAAGTTDGPSIESLLMSAWLMSRLQWVEPQVQKTGDETWTITVSAGGNRVLITLKPKAETRSPIIEIVIHSELADKSAAFRSALADHPDEVLTEAQAPDIPDVRRTVSLEPMSRSKEVCRVLDTPGRDRLYEGALPLIDELVNQIGSQK